MSDHEQQPLHGWVLAGAVTMLVSLLGIAIVLSLGIAKGMANPMHHGALFLLELLFTIGLIMTSADLVVRAVAGRVVRALAEECQRMDHLEVSLTQLRRDYVAASVDGLVAAVPNLAPALASAHDMPRQRLLRDGHSPDEIDTYAADMSRYVELGRELEPVLGRDLRRGHLGALVHPNADQQVHCRSAGPARYLADAGLSHVDILG